MNVTDVRLRLDEIRAELNTAIKESLADAYLATFADPSITNVVFGVSTCPYNDGSLREGIFGPYANFELGPEGDFGYDEQWNLLDYRTNGTKAPQVEKVLNEAEWDNVARAFGIDGEAALAIVAERRDDGNFRLFQYTIESDY